MGVWPEDGTTAVSGLKAAQPVPQTEEKNPLNGAGSQETGEKIPVESVTAIKLWPETAGREPEPP